MSCSAGVTVAVWLSSPTAATHVFPPGTSPAAASTLSSDRTGMVKIRYPAASRAACSIRPRCFSQ
jgi:hypothetical protein